MSLPAWLADPALSGLWSALHEKLERYGPTWRGTVTMAGLTAGERRALSTLLGRPVLTTSYRLDLGDLDDRLVAAGGLVAVVERATGGGVADRRSVRANVAAEPDAAVQAARALLPDDDWVGGWLTEVRRLAPSPADAAAAARTLLQLGAGRRVSRVDLAAEVLGSSHGLDDDAPVTGLVLRGLAQRFGCLLPLDAQGRRELWALAGVSGDDVSSTCLVRGLPLLSGDLAQRVSSGDPVHVTRRDLRRHPFAVAAGTRVLVVENPRVLEAVADADLAVAVVCGNGNPNNVTMDVLQALAGCGAVLRYHGDFDWAGLTIANRLVRAVGVQPWAMSPADYRAAPPGLPLRGSAVEAAWDPALTVAMTARGVAVHEEACLPDLLDRLLSL
ncbi:MAG: hypothetical protein QOI76_107 [Frankiales bacterium]|nr:hypothetical protein [Frankiales bacterium]